MIGRLILAALLAQAPAVYAEQGSPEQFLPPEILKACPDPKKIAPMIRGCTTNFVAVEWAVSCGKALDKLTKLANEQLQATFAAEAVKSHNGQSGNLGNTSTDLIHAKISFEQLISAGKLFLANQKVYQSLVAYPGGENKGMIHALGLTGVYSSFRCVKSSVDAVGAEIAATQKKIEELQSGNLAASSLWKKTDSRDQALGGNLNGTRMAPNPAQQGAAPGEPLVRKVSGKSDGNANSITGVDKALEDKRKGEKILQQSGSERSR